jgi:hypothetical protein
VRAWGASAVRVTLQLLDRNATLTTSRSQCNPSGHPVLSAFHTGARHRASVCVWGGGGGGAGGAARLAVARPEHVAPRMRLCTGHRCATLCWRCRGAPSCCPAAPTLVTAHDRHIAGREPGEGGGCARVCAGEGGFTKQRVLWWGTSAISLPKGCVAQRWRAQVRPPGVLGASRKKTSVLAFSNCIALYSDPCGARPHGCISRAR